MINVRVDNEELAADISQLRTMGELIELIKASIDPDTIIVSLSVEGQALSESDWRMPLAVHDQHTLQVDTGSREQYLEIRLQASKQYVDQIIDEFRSASTNYLGGDSQAANTGLSAAVEDLLAFVNWYIAVLSVKAEMFGPQIEEFDTRIKSIQKVCEDLVQQQIFQSWQSLGQKIQGNLEPELLGLKDFCERASEVSLH